jgi:hypothetical protein
MGAAASEKRSDLVMPIPRGPFHAVGYGFVWLIVTGSVGAALFNLSRPMATPVTALLASVAWLLLVGTMLAVARNVAGGTRQYLINCLGDFAARQLVWIEWRGEDSPHVCFGFQMGRGRPCYVRIRMDAIAKVEWRTGQASALAGRDMNDWYVSIKFDKRKSTITPLGRPYPHRFYTVGPSGPRETVEEFGLEFVKLLISAGARLAPTKDGRLYRRTRLMSGNAV